MKLLNTYEDREEAEAAALKITGEKRLASERDSTVVSKRNNNHTLRCGC